MTRIQNLALTFSLLAAGCTPGVLVASTEPPPSSSPTPDVFLTLTSSSEEIRQAMMASTSRWRTLHIDGIVSRGQPSQTFREQVWLEPSTSRFRVVLSDAGGATPATLKVCDGQMILEINLTTGQGASTPLPEFARQDASSPPHPLWGQIGTGLSEVALAANYASDQGQFVPISIDAIAGRETVVVEWTLVGAALPQWRMWLDTRTAVILKLQEFAKGGGVDLLGERLVTSISYDGTFDPSLFSAPSEIPTFEPAGPVASPGDSTPVPPVNAPQGELYFFALPHEVGKSISLVRLPGACVTGDAPCLPLETVTAPFPFNFTLSPLAWSPDGSLAAFAYPTEPAGTPTKLLIFDPASGAWRWPTEFPYVDPPFWSPDGTWIAFRVQDGTGGEDVYAMHRDGTGLKNLTGSGQLPASGRPYVMDGWLTENVIVRSALPGTEGGVYLLRASDGAVRPLFETLLTKAPFIVSPDSAWLAFDDYDYATQRHALKVTEPDAGNPVDVAAFAGGSLYPIVWAPDSARLAFAHSTTDSTLQPVSNVYVIGRDGRGLTNAYQGSTVGRLLFSPDGTHLLVEETTTPTGGHLFIVDLNTLERRLLSAPGLTLDLDWYAPSWRP